MKYLYFPGCALKGNGKAYEESFQRVFKELNIELQELDDWNCCGATIYMSVNEMEAFTLATRNLALAEKVSDELLIPCGGCFLALEKARRYINDYPEVGQKVREALKTQGLEYHGKIKLRHPIEVLVEDYGVDEIAKRVKVPLKGLKVAPYYGCQIVRPYSNFDNPDNPTMIERILEALGATVVSFPLKTKCCGGILTGACPEVGLEHTYHLLDAAQQLDADLMVTICALCHFNLDSYQDKISKHFGKVNMPVLYFPQIVGVALGIPGKEIGLKRNIISAEPVLEEMGLCH